ncbi:DUF58 domain-containing protein [Aliiglaciecola litoralis]|uniref:DUF58 domain-containing protein n=1 Tax=Aliiglaciecola litoralis TaxID=582857 RepID=A0ABP3WP78_9ALTE
MQDVNKWLNQLHTDGVSLNIKQLLYYQTKTSLMNLAPRKTIQSKLAGSYLAKTKGRGMEFDEARHYQPGDDIRAIDWRVTARTGKTHTKLYREEKERPIFILADLSSSMHFGTQLLFKSVQVAHLASLIAWAASSRGDRVGGLIYNQHRHTELKPFTRQKAVLGFLHGLIDMHSPEDLNPGELKLSDACARLRRLVHPGSLIFVLSDFQQLDDITKQHLSRISRHSEVIAYSITDPFEHELPQVSSVQSLEITDGEAQQSLVLGEKQTALQYKVAHQQRFQQLAHVLRQCKVQTLPITAASALETQLVQQGRAAK